MISFANPAFLWSLLGLSVPIAIHFLSRKEGQVIKLGSLKHMQETSTQQFRGIRLNEIWLLILRCLLIVLLSLLLSGMSFTSAGKEKWGIVEWGVEKEKSVQALLDTLDDSGYELRWLAPNFPLLKDSAGLENSSYGSLVEELKKKNLEEGVILSWSKAEKFRGQRVALPEYIKWITIPAAERKFILQAIQQNDSVLVRSGISDSESTSFETITQSNSSSIELSAAKRIRVYVEPVDNRQRIVLEAVIRAIDESTPFCDISFTPIDSAEWIFWLSGNPIPTQSAKIISLEPKSSAKMLEQVNNTHWSITRSINEENVLHENFSVMLAQLLTRSDALQNVVKENDQRIVSDSLLWASTDSVLDKFTPSQKSAAGYLFIVMILVLLAERLLSYHRQQ